LIGVACEVGKNDAPRIYAESQVGRRTWTSRFGGRKWGTVGDDPQWPSVNGGWRCIWVGGLQGKFHAKDLGGYAIFGAIYFLIAGVLLSRKLSQATAA
jgi:hypothetical protein